MTSTMKILLRLLPLGILLLIAIAYHSSNNSGYDDNTERNAVELQIIRRRRRVKPATIHYCKFNQYYDQEEGRCLGVPGGGKVLHVENRRSCGLNVLKPHCKSSLYYYICKRDKSILAQCANRQIFDNRLQRCVYYDSSNLIPNIILPDNYMYYDHIRVPSCTRYGRFPVLGHCSMFYTCDTNGHRFYQSVFKCPQNTGYQVDRGVCNVASDCPNDNSVDTVCVPNAPGETVESVSLDKTAEKNVEETPEIIEESKTNADDLVVEREKNINSMIYEDIITTPESITDTQLENYNDNNMDVSSNNANLSKSIKEVLVPDSMDEEVYSQDPNLLETMQKASDDGQNEENESSLLGTRITPETTELGVSQSMPESTPISDVLPNIDSIDPYSAPTVSDVPESSSISDVSPSIDEKMLDAPTEQYKNNEDTVVIPPNIDSVDPYSAPTVSVPESSSISDASPNIDERMVDAPTEEYRNNEDTVIPSNTDSVDPYLTPTVSDVPESSSISDVSPSIDEKMLDAPTEQYKNNEDTVVIPPNIDSVDPYSAPTVSVPESSSISDASPNIDERMVDAPTEEYRNNEDTVIPSNTDSVDPYLTPTVSDVPESSSISDVSPSIDEKMLDAPTEQYKNNEDTVVIPPNIDSVDPYSAPTVSVPESSSISDASPNIDERMVDAPTEEYRNNEDTVVPSNTDSVDPYLTPTVTDVPESSPISDVSPNIDEKMLDASTEQYRNNEDTVVPSNTDSVDPYSTPTVSDVPESSSISDVSPNIDEKMLDASTEQYKNNEDTVVIPPNTDSVDPYLTPTVSDVPESSSISDVSPNIGEEILDSSTEQYRNNEDTVVIPPNTDSIDPYSPPTVSDVPESSSISDVSPSIDEKMLDAPTEQYKNNEDTVVPSNTDSVDPYLTPTVSDVPESSSISDVSPNIGEEILDSSTEQYRNNEDTVVIPPNTDSIDPYSPPTVSDVPESSSISDVSPSIDEMMLDTPTEQYKNNEDTVVPSNTDSVDPYLTPTVSDVPESSPISDASPNIDEKIQDASTEQYRNNEDTGVISPNIDSIDPYSAPTVSDVPESSSISDVSPSIDEKMLDAPTEQYKNNEDTVVPSNTDSVDPYLTPTVSDVPESSSISDVSPNIGEEILDSSTEQYRNNEDTVVIPPNTDSIDPYSPPTVSDVPESSSISDVSPSIDEMMLDTPTEQYKNNEDTVVPSNTDSVDPYLTPTVSDVPESSPISDASPNIDEKIQDASTEQYRNNEDTGVISPNIDSIDPYSAPTVSDVPESSSISDVSPSIDEKMQNASTEQYRNNEDTVVIPPNTDSVDPYSAPTVSDVPESSPISDVSSNIDEKIQDASTEQYRNNEDTVVPPNTDSIDPYSASTVSDVSESSPVSDASSNIDEKKQDASTEQYRNNEDTVVPSNTDSIDPYSAPTVSDVPESSPINESASSNVDEKMQAEPTE